MSQKIIKPEGMELMEYLNNGYAVCNRCVNYLTIKELSTQEGVLTRALSFCF